MTNTELATYFATVRRNFGFADQVSLDEINQAVRDQCRGRTKSPQSILLAMLRTICNQRDDRRLAVIALRNTRAILQKLENMGVSQDDIIRQLADNKLVASGQSMTGSP